MTTVITYSTKISTSHTILKEVENTQLDDLKLRLRRMSYTLDEMKTITKNCSLHLKYFENIKPMVNEPILKTKLNPKINTKVCGSGYKAAIHLR